MARNGKKVVLIIDDDENWQLFLKEELSQYADVEVLQAFDPAEGIREADRHMQRLDLIMLDGNFGAGELGGEEVAESIIMHGYTGMIIAMSSDDERNEHMVHAGCRGRVHKENTLAKMITLLGVG